MHGSAVTLANAYLSQPARPSLILATDMLDLNVFLALTRRQTGSTPSALYMHENQLTYPLPSDGGKGPMRRQKGERDLHYAFINFSSMLAADRVFFNSSFHQRSFFAALPNFLKHFPDYNALETIPSLEAKSVVLPVGVDLARLDRDNSQATTREPPLIIWNHRWEYDKNPAAFFKALYSVARDGFSFRLAICGENFRRRPVEFDEALERLSERIIFRGFAEDDDYHRLLSQADITISTAEHDFFGISVVEAMYSRVFPILPNRLSYPDLIPEQFHEVCLYDDEETLVRRLEWALTHRRELVSIVLHLSEVAARYDWAVIAPRYDSALGELAALTT